jgi:predicted TIM-barrel fold metal-dependent hydrolase
LEQVAPLPRLRLVLLDHSGATNKDFLRKLTRAGQVYVDIADVEGVGGVDKLVEIVPAERVLFGSHYPFFYYESAVTKLRESKLEPAREKAIRYDNAKRLLSPS